MPIDIPEHLSFSQVSTLKKCGEQWRLERGLHIPSRPSWAAIGGSAVHTATEVLDGLMLRDGVVPDQGLIEGTFSAAFAEKILAEAARTGYEPEEFYVGGRASKAWPDKENKDWWLHNGPLHVAGWVTWARNSMMTLEPDDIEIEFEIELGGRKVRGFIDRLMGGTVVDIKTGSWAPQDGGMQLGIYSEAILQLRGYRPTHGIYWMARTGGTGLPYDLSVWTKERLDFEFANATKKQELQLFEAIPSALCKACGVRDYCYAVGGSKADTVPRPWDKE